MSVQQPSTTRKGPAFIGVSSVFRRLKRTHHRRITKKVGLVTFMHYDLGFFDEEAIGVQCAQIIQRFMAT